MQLTKIQMSVKIVVILLCGIFTNINKAFCMPLQDTVQLNLEGTNGQYRNQIFEHFLTHDGSIILYNITLKYSTELRSNLIHICYRIVDTDKILICNRSSSNFLIIYRYDLSSVDKKPVGFLYNLEDNHLLQITLDDFSFVPKKKKLTIWYRFEEGYKVITRQWISNKSGVLSGYTTYRNRIVVKYLTRKIKKLTGVGSLLLSDFEQFYGVEPSRDLKSQLN